MPVTSLSIVMPCLNEEQTIASCISKAKNFIQGLTVPAEILIADNGSRDNSVPICNQSGVRCISVPVKGYGAALHQGVLQANGSHVIFADADDSYNFQDSGVIYDALNSGSDIVVGNRFKGGIKKKAMPLLHRYLGTPVISFLGRKAFNVRLRDFNCGFRGLDKEKYLQLNLQSHGMEYATEMIAKASYKNLKIIEVPVTLYKSGRNRPSHLNTWRDGWKHFRLILLLSPKWLLLFPSIFFLLLGLVSGTLLIFSNIRLSSIIFDIHTLYYSSVFLILSFQLFQFYILTKLHGYNVGLYPEQKLPVLFIRWFSFEKGLVLGSIAFLAGLVLSFIPVWIWRERNFGPMHPASTFRLIIPAGFLIITGMQTIIFGFLLSTFNSIHFKKK